MVYNLQEPVTLSLVCLDSINQFYSLEERFLSKNSGLDSSIWKGEYMVLFSKGWVYFLTSYAAFMSLVQFIAATME